MPVQIEAYKRIKAELDKNKVSLVAVSKGKTAEEIEELYQAGQRDFGENYVQELLEKKDRLPGDIRWHFIGHLQTNKVKQLAPFVQLIQSVDSLKLLEEINKQAEREKRVIDCLLQLDIAHEETKFGMDEKELSLTMEQFTDLKMKNVCIRGLMGMGSFVDDMNKLREEFGYLKKTFDHHARLPIANCQLSILSMGMSNDYKTAIESGSTMVRIGSLIFGERN